MACAMNKLERLHNELDFANAASAQFDIALKFVPESIEEFMIGKVRRKLPFFAVEKNQIDIRAMIELVATEFAQGQNGKLCCRRAVTAPKFHVPMFENALDTNFCYLRKLGRG